MASSEAERNPSIMHVSSLEDKAGTVAEVAYTNHDEAELAALGKKQQLRVCGSLCMRFSVLTMQQRNFSFAGILGFSCILMATWEGLLT